MNAGAALAVLAAIAYGAADFCGGIASRRTATTAVLIWSQGVGLVVLMLVFPFVHGHSSGVDVIVGVAAGVFGALGIGLLYAALARGRMSVVSPIAAVVGAAVPVAAGILAGDRVPPLAATGFALAFLAILAITAGGARSEAGGTRSETGGAGSQAGGGRVGLEPGVALAVGSGVAIGLLFVAIAHGHPEGRLAVVAVARLVSLPLLALFAVVTRRSLRLSRATAGIVVLAGALDMTANVGFAIATRIAPLSVAAVLVSLYPVSTVLLAVVIARERLTRIQGAGVAAAVASVTAIASAS